MNQESLFIIQLTIILFLSKFSITVKKMMFTVSFMGRSQMCKTKQKEMSIHQLPQIFQPKINHFYSSLKIIVTFECFLSHQVIHQQLQVHREAFQCVYNQRVCPIRLLLSLLQRILVVLIIQILNLFITSRILYSDLQYELYLVEEEVNGENILSFKLQILFFLH